MSTSLRARLLATFVAYALVVAAVFGLSAATFLYTAEDRFFDALLDEESATVEAHRRASGAWGVPRHAWMLVHPSPASLPPDLRSQLTAAPWRREFRGAGGRHYHVRALGARAAGDDARPAAWLVAEVSDRLVIRPMRGDLLAQFLVAEGVLLALAVTLALAIARRIARPLMQLAESVRRLDPAAPGDGTALASHRQDRELAIVAHALDEMRRRLATFVEREHAFTRDASHELRTPLTVIRSATARALDDCALPVSVRPLLERSLRSAEQLERTTRTLLALARERPMDRPAAPTAIRPVLEDVVLEQAAALDARGLTLHLALPRDATLPASAPVLRILLSNILGNACAHSAPGAVQVQWRDDTLTVENPVPHRPPPPGDPPRSAAACGESGPGYGLGLAISARLCTRSGLALEVDTSAPGRFAVRVRRAVPPRSPPAAGFAADSLGAPPRAVAP